MKWMEVKIVYQHDNQQLAGDLIANLFYDLGLQGVCMEDPLEEGDPDWGTDAVPLPDHYAVCGYLALNEAFESQRLSIETGLARLHADYRIHNTIHYRSVNEEDWAEAWKAFFWPEKVTDRIVIKPTWRTYEPTGDEIVIEIDPGMAFGTGTHPTTSMCIQLVDTHLKTGDAFLDVGTGSGILMVTAARLGAAYGRGIDNDLVAVEIARANLALNSADPGLFQVTTGDLVRDVRGPFNFVTANILSEVILDLLAPLKGVLAPGARVVFSGIITANAPAVAKKMRALGYRVDEQITQEEWVAIAGRWPGDE
jgi:ribosomal protein L11 methyltransferase